MGKNYPGVTSPRVMQQKIDAFLPFWLFVEDPAFVDLFFAHNIYLDMQQCILRFMRLILFALM